MSSKRAKRQPTPAIDAVMARDMSTLRVALQTPGATDEIDADGRTPLHHASIQGDEAAARLLLERGAQVNAQDGEGWTALHFAASGYHANVAAVLLQHHAVVDVEDSNGNTALFRAVFNSKGREDVIRLLLANGANREHKNKHDMSPIDLAGTIANYDMKRMFA